MISLPPPPSHLLSHLSCLFSLLGLSSLYVPFSCTVVPCSCRNSAVTTCEGVSCSVYIMCMSYRISSAHHWKCPHCTSPVTPSSLPPCPERHPVVQCGSTAGRSSPAVAAPSQHRVFSDSHGAEEEDVVREDAGRQGTSLQTDQDLHYWSGTLPHAPETTCLPNFFSLSLY